MLGKSFWKLLKVPILLFLWQLWIKLISSNAFYKHIYAQLHAFRLSEEYNAVPGCRYSYQVSKEIMVYEIKHYCMGQVI